MCRVELERLSRLRLVDHSQHNVIRGGAFCAACFTNARGVCAVTFERPEWTSTRFLPRQAPPRVCSPAAQLNDSGPEGACDAATYSDIGLQAGCLAGPVP